MSKPYEQILLAQALKVFGEEMSKDLIRSTLKLEDGYDRDNPASPGKRLELDKIHLLGEKRDGTLVDTKIEFSSGVNLWIADNSTGKSSIFKAIKLALTGRKSLKKNIAKWISEIWLNFSIGENYYTSVVYLSTTQKALLIAGRFSSQDEIKELNSSQLLFEAIGIEDFETKIQGFFFHQFSYYSLGWTQADSMKRPILHDSKTTWATFFKSIYLESKDAGNLIFGNQPSLIVQMILGLQFTYAINRLKVKRDKSFFEFNKAISNKKRGEQIKNEEQPKLTQRLKEVNQKIEEKVKGESIIPNSSENLQQQEKLTASIAQRSLKTRQLRSEIEKHESDNVNTERLSRTHKKNLEKTHSSIVRLEKQRLKLMEFLEFEVFVSNLDITICPHCNHGINEERRTNEQSTHQCRVCQHEIGDSEIDKSYYENKGLEISKRIEKLKIEAGLLERRVLEAEGKTKELKRMVQSLELEVENLQKENVRDTNDLKAIENQLQKLRHESLAREKEVYALYAEKGALDQQIKQLQESNTPSTDGLRSNELAQQVQLLDWAHQQLMKERLERSSKILSSIEELMLEELTHLGVRHVSGVELKADFQPRLIQDGEILDFSEITEGEQLRVKIAFYLTLIKLDIEMNVGRHPRFLIIDSPAKEEGDSKYLEGLSEALQSIEKRYGQKMQLFVGTAVRELEGSAPKEKTHVYGKDQFLF